MHIDKHTHMGMYMYTGAYIRTHMSAHINYIERYVHTHMQKWAYTQRHTHTPHSISG